jgi:hypothetical protein
VAEFTVSTQVFGASVDALPLPPPQPVMKKLNPIPIKAITSRRKPRIPMLPFGSKLCTQPGLARGQSLPLSFDHEKSPWKAG